MGTLTKQEREALEDVFLSIHSTDKFKKLRILSTLIIPTPRTVNFRKLLKQPKYGLNETKLSHFLLNLTKKKKNLSK